MWLALAGCTSGGSTETDRPGTAPTEHTGTPPEDTGPDGAYLDAAAFTVVARFGWDAATARHRQVADHDQGWRPMELDVVLLDSTALAAGADPSNSCAVRFTFTDPQPVAAWGSAHGDWTALDVPPDATVVDGCRFYGLPPVFEGDVAGKVSRFSWGVGLAPLEDEVEYALLYALGSSQWAALEPWAVGGVVRSDALDADDGYSPSGYALGFELTDNFEVREDAAGSPVPLPREQVFDGAALATGYYEVSLGTYAPGDALAQ